MNRRSKYRDLEKARNTAREQKRRYRAATGSGHYPPRAWSIEEIDLIMAVDRPLDRVLGKMISRSVQAIHVRRSMCVAAERAVTK